MIDYVRVADTVVIHDFSRLARSTKYLLERQREGTEIAKQKGKLIKEYEGGLE